MTAPHERYDVAVVGLGAFGSAAAWFLAERGVNVIGLDRHTPPHAEGSSHGNSRIIREAYAEDPLYVPWLQRSYELWDELERATGRHLLTRCGGLMIGQPGTELVEGSRASAREHRLGGDVLPPETVAERWPGTFRLPADTVAVFDPRAGVLAPERSIDAFLTQARRAGAELRVGTAVADWQADSRGAELQLADGSTITAKRLVLAAGPWMSDLVPAVAPVLEVARQVMHWFSVAPERSAAPENFPIFVWEHDSPRIFYGFPDEGEGVKVAIHHDGELTTVGAVERDVRPSEVTEIQQLVDRYLPGLCGDWLRSAVCMYTNTPDGHFIVDSHPEHRRVLLASPCSGHGFKFAPALGEAIADWATGSEPRTPLADFALERLDAPRDGLVRVRTGAARFEGEPRAT